MLVIGIGGQEPQEGKAQSLQTPFQFWYAVGGGGKKGEKGEITVSGHLPWHLHLTLSPQTCEDGERVL